MLELILRNFFGTLKVQATSLLANEAHALAMT
jgi:hypothetical protein